MVELLINSFYVFFIVLKILLFVYILSKWIPLGAKTRVFINGLLEPLINPVQYLMKHSIFISKFDLSPFIAMIIITYFQNIFYYLK
jgi:YggT family protein